MHQVLRIVGLALILALIFATDNQALGESWAVVAGDSACPNFQTSSCASVFDECLLYAPSSYFPSSEGSPPFAASSSRQLVATPFRFSGLGQFEVQGMRLIFGLTNETNVNLTLFIYKANTTDPTLPGDALDAAWGSGVRVLFSKTSTTPVSALPVGGRVAFYQVAASLTPFNLSAGTYFVSAASYGSLTPRDTGAYNIGGYNVTSIGASYAAYRGISPHGTLIPAVNINATNSWGLGVANVIACVWPTGKVWDPPQGGNSTNSTTTTGSTTSGSNTTTGGTTGTTAGGTTGGSSGGENPTDYLVRYPLTTDLNDLNPAGFISAVSTALQLPAGAQIEIVAARRAQVTQAEGKRVVEQGTLLDFYIADSGSGSEGASFMEKALSAKLSDLRDHNVTIASAPTQVNAEASSASLLLPGSFLSPLIHLADW